MLRPPVLRAHPNLHMEAELLVEPAVRFDSCGWQGFMITTEEAVPWVSQFCCDTIGGPLRTCFPTLRTMLYLTPNRKTRSHFGWLLFSITEHQLMQRSGRTAAFSLKPLPITALLLECGTHTRLHLKNSAKKIKKASLLTAFTASLSHN